MNKNMLVLAYLGDAIYETYIRKYLIDTGIVKVNKLQSESIKYVSAKSQAEFLKTMIENNYLKEDELKIVITARNITKPIEMLKNNHKPKNCDIITYKYATGLEALIGYLYYNDDFKRIDEIMSLVVKLKNESQV